MNINLEAAIDKAGRDEVFLSARALGWDSAPPEWVWWEIVRTIEQNGSLPCTNPPKSRSETLGLGGLF